MFKKHFIIPAVIAICSVFTLSGCASQGLKTTQKQETAALKALHKAERKVEVSQKAVAVSTAALVASQSNLVKAKAERDKRKEELKAIIEKK